MKKWTTEERAAHALRMRRVWRQRRQQAARVKKEATAAVSKPHAHLTIYANNPNTGAVEQQQNHSFPQMLDALPTILDALYGGDVVYEVRLALHSRPPRHRHP